MINGMHVGRAGWAWGRCVAKMTGMEEDAIHQSWFKWDGGRCHSSVMVQVVTLQVGVMDSVMLTML